MKTLGKTWVLLSLLLVLVMATVAEARVGGGRSSGARGFRGFGTRSQPIAPSRPMQQPNYQNPGQPQQPFGATQPGMGGGNFARGLMGGLAGGFIGSMLFRNSGHANGGAGGGGGFGLLELLLFAGIGYFIYKRYFARKLAGAGAGHGMNAYRGGEVDAYEKLRSVPPGPFASTGGSPGVGLSAEDELRKIDSSIDYGRFKEDRMDDFVSLQAAWNHRDLSSIEGKLAPELKRSLEADIAELKASRLVNRIENIAVRGTDLVEAWAERGSVYATLRFRANLTDYTVEESSGNVVAGDRTTPVKFEEDWTFVRELDGAPGSWRVSAIEA
jgi:predicted lipid-binding transport protein (Tim44 family)